MSPTDRWASWLAELRTAGNEDERRRGLERLAAWRDRILDNADLQRGETLLDVGCGEGLVGFGALERGAGTVVFSDISSDLLDFCHDAASELGLLDRVRLVEAPAEDLSAIASDSVDVVTMRSVLIYVADKEAAFDEFFRVLRPGGRLSLFEPVNRFAQTNGDTWMGYDLAPVAEIAAKVRAVYARAQPPETDPMFDFDERRLLELADAAGFFPLRLELESAIEAPDFRSWDALLNIPPNPRAPSLADAMVDALDEQERKLLVSHLRPLVEGGLGVSRRSHLFLTGVKPGANGGLPRAS